MEQICMQFQGTRCELRSDDAARGAEEEGRDFRLAGQPRAGPVLPQQAARHPRDRGDAHRGAHHEDPELPAARRQRCRAGPRHGRSQANRHEAQQGKGPCLHQRVRKLNPSHKFKGDDAYHHFHFRVSH